MQLHRARGSIEKKGARIVIVGNGGPHFFEAFREKTGYAGPLYSDPDLRAYRALGLRRDLRSVLNLGAMKQAIAAYRQGYRQTRLQGDPWQQGGVFVVDGHGHVLYEHRSRFAGDHPRLSAIVAAIPGGGEGACESS